MSKEYFMKLFKAISLVLILGVSMTACGAGKSSWKEEVLLHDGTKLIVERSQTYGGNHELGQTSCNNHGRVIWLYHAGYTGSRRSSGPNFIAVSRAPLVSGLA